MKHLPAIGTRGKSRAWFKPWLDAERRQSRADTAAGAVQAAAHLFHVFAIASTGQNLTDDMGDDGVGPPNCAAICRSTSPSIHSARARNICRKRKEADSVFEKLPMRMTRSARPAPPV